MTANTSKKVEYVSERTIIVQVGTQDAQWGIVASTPERRFQSGSVGFHVSGKIVDPSTGKRYQLSGSVVEIGSKPKA